MAESTWIDANGIVHTVKTVKRQEIWEETDGDDDDSGSAYYDEDSDNGTTHSHQPVDTTIKSATKVKMFNLKINILTSFIYITELYLYVFFKTQKQKYKREGPTILEHIFPLLGIDVPFKVYLGGKLLQLKNSN